MNIRQAKETEYKEIIAFYHDLITKIQPYPCHPTWIIGVYPSDDYLKELTLNGQVFIGLEDNNIVAAMVLNNNANEGYDSVPWKANAPKDEVSILHLLCVLPERWGKGYGKELLDYAVEYLKTKGQKVLRLDAMEENLPAIKLYEQYGFTNISTITMYYEATGWSGFTMFEKELSSCES